LFFIFGRHVAVFQNIKNGFPAFQLTAGTGSEIAIECVQGDLALTLFRSMTLDAILLKKRFH